MTTTSIRNRAAFTRWADAAQPGEVAVYHNSGKTRNELLFQTARALFEADRVILYQHHAEDGSWDYCAQRCSSTTAGWLARMSHAIHTPTSRYAYS